MNRWTNVLKKLSPLLWLKFNKYNCESLKLTSSGVRQYGQTGFVPKYKLSHSKPGITLFLSCLTWINWGMQQWSLESSANRMVWILWNLKGHHWPSSPGAISLVLLGFVWAVLSTDCQCGTILHAMLLYPPSSAWGAGSQYSEQKISVMI